MRTIKFSRFIQPYLINSIAFQASTQAKVAKKTYYQILQVTTNATMANIKQNYLRLAKIYHPDVYKGKDKTRFEKIQQAYKTLSDKAKRNKYDEQIGLRRTDRETEQGSDFKFRSEGQGAKVHPDKPKNTMQYERKGEAEESIDLDEQFNKFFGKKPKTKFEQIHLSEQPQIRGMSQAERIRRHFSETYQQDKKLLKTEYQKQFDSIINDQINQRNRMYEDSVKAQAKNREMHSQKGIKRLKWKVILGFTIFSLVTLPVFYSYATKYRIQKQMQRTIQEKWAQTERQVKEMAIRYRLKY